MSSPTLQSHIGILRKIESPDEHYEAAGFVMDCILANGMIDDPLGDTASLRPTDIVRGSDGSIVFVLCSVRPCNAQSIGLENVADDRVAIFR